MANNEESWLARMTERLLALDKWSRFCLLCAAVAVTFVIFNVWGALDDRTGHAKELAANAEAIASLEEQIAAVRGEPVQEVEEVTDAIEAATLAGNTMCDIQNKVLADSEFDATSRIERLIDKDSNTRLGKWVLGLQGGYTWHFCEAYDYTGDSVPMLWQAVSDDGLVLGYAKASYVVSDGLIHDIDCKLTLSGQGNVGASAENEDADSDVASGEDASGEEVGE